VYEINFVSVCARLQVRDIEATVLAAVKALDPGASCVVCGSYRRGQPSCGDIDVLIYADDGREDVCDVMYVM
jgi:DNA polymerase lambda